MTKWEPTYYSYIFWTCLYNMVMYLRSFCCYFTEGLCIWYILLSGSVVFYALQLHSSLLTCNLIASGNFVVLITSSALFAGYQSMPTMTERPPPELPDFAHRPGLLALFSLTQIANNSIRSCFILSYIRTCHLFVVNCIAHDRSRAVAQ